MRRAIIIAIAVAVAVAWCLAGCANVKVVPVRPGDTKTEGVRFWAPHPYLLVTKGTYRQGADKQNDDPRADPPATGQEVTNTYLIWLPDPDKEYAIQLKGGSGAANAKITLKNGWMLDTFNAEADAKVPETIEALTGAFKALPIGLKQESQGLIEGILKEVPPGLYRFEFNGGAAVALVPVVVDLTSPQLFGLERLAGAAQETERIIGEFPSGYRPPVEEYDRVEQPRSTGVPIVVYVTPGVTSGDNAIVEVHLSLPAANPVTVSLTHTEYPATANQDLLYAKRQSCVVPPGSAVNVDVATRPGTDGGRVVTIGTRTDTGETSDDAELRIDPQ